MGKMKETLMQSCQLFIENKEEMKRAFRWDSSNMITLCAHLYAKQMKPVDSQRIKDCKQLIKKSTGMFSNFKSTTLLALATLLSFENDPEEALLERLRIYDLIKEQFSSSEYLPLASFILAKKNEMASVDEMNVVIKKAKDLYNEMKSEHPFLTSREDSCFAILLAMSDIGSGPLVREMEECYNLLKHNGYEANAMQSLSQVLVLGDQSAKNKTDRVISMFRGLRDAGCRYSKDMELTALGLLAILDEDQQILISEVVEVDTYLSKQKGFGIFGLDARQRMMYSVLIVASQYTVADDASLENTTLIQSVTCSIIAEQTAVMAAVMVAGAAAAVNSTT